eukprot:scaffold39574_cov216-Skeletonema_dohrnii-CCMP3373.AAC.5
MYLSAAYPHPFTKNKEVTWRTNGHRCPSPLSIAQIVAKRFALGAFGLHFITTLLPPASSIQLSIVDAKEPKQCSGESKGTSLGRSQYTT